MTEPWWKSAVVYQIYPRSFADTNGDGVGDLEGIRRHLDHLTWLGVDAIWISPFFTSPMKDYGYDVSDYCDVDPIFGDLGDFDRLLAEAHERGIRVIIDWVPNHTSDLHPWFVASKSSKDDPKRDWYIWRDPKPDGSVPNNWIALFTDETAWELDEASGQYYLHLFLPEQPDLNWANPEVEAAMHDTLRFWLDRGVDGFRMDVIHAIGKDPALPDNVTLVDYPHSDQNNHESTHPLLRRIRKVLEEYPGDRMMVGEVFLPETAWVRDYYGQDDELHLSFNFATMFARWRSDMFSDVIDGVATHIEPVGWPTWVLNNHDVPRFRSRVRWSEPKSRAAAVLLLTLRGTPFLYAGEELGLLDAFIPEDRVVDPGGRDGCRAPIPWNDTPEHGWGTTDPWLPWPPELDTHNVASEQADPVSTASLYRRLLTLRGGSPALQTGAMERLEAPTGVLAWARVADGERWVTVVNFTGQPVEFAVGGTWAASSDTVTPDGPYPGSVAPYEAVLFGPDATTA